MDKADIYNDNIKHIRFIHFSLLIACITSIYFSVLVWSKEKEFLPEIKQIENIVNLIGKAPKITKTLYELFPEEMAKINDDIRLLLGDNLGLSASWENYNNLNNYNSFEILKYPLYDVSENNQFFYIREAIDQAEWLIRVPSSLSISSDVTDWLKPEALTGAEHSRVKIKSINVSNGRNSNNKFIGTIELIALDWAKVLMIGNKEDMGAFPVGKTRKFNFEWEEKKIRVSFYNNTFKDKFPNIYNNFDDIKMKTLKSISTWVKEKKILPLTSRPIEILGLKIDAKHLGIIGPIIIFGLMFYLLANVLYLSKNLEILKTNKLDSFLIDDKLNQFFVSWIGIVDNWVAVIVSFVTLFILPILAIIISLWFLGDKNIFITFVSILSAISLGSACFIISNKLRNSINEEIIY